MVKEIAENKIIMGDIIIDLNISSRYIEDYKNLPAALNLEIKTKGPTRTGHKLGMFTQTHIDHVYVKNIKGKVFIIESNISDHNIIGMTPKHKFSESGKSYKHIYNINNINNVT